MKHDIQSEKDIIYLVDSFYDKVNQDPLLSPVFNEEVKVDWKEHLPKMYKFWGTQLIGTMDYKGQPFPPHMILKITTEHFSQWQKLFIQTVNELFEGPTADLAVYKAQNIATIFQFKLGLTERKM